MREKEKIRNNHENEYSDPGRNMRSFFTMPKEGIFSKPA